MKREEYSIDIENIVGPVQRNQPERVFSLAYPDIAAQWYLSRPENVHAKSTQEQIHLLFLVNNGHVSQKDLSFATNIGKAKKLSPRQLEWVKILIERYDPVIKAAKVATATKSVANLSIKHIVSFFDAAGTHLKFPKVRLVKTWLVKGANFNSEFAQANCIRIKRAGKKSKYPGSLAIDEGAFENYVGRIHTDGNLVLSHLGKKYEQQLVTLLKQFADKPATMAANHGKLMGICCFCSSALKDQRSTDVGYGPVCAAHYSLNWGNQKREPARLAM